MNSQVLVDREFIEEIADNLGFDARDVRYKVRALLAAPAPIADAGELERLVTEQVKNAYYARKTITEAVGEIVSALQADHSEHVRSMVAPDGWKLVPVDPTIEMIAAIGFDGDVDLAIGHAAISAQCVETYRNLLAAAPATGGDV